MDAAVVIGDRDGMTNSPRKLLWFEPRQDGTIEGFFVVLLGAAVGLWGLFVLLLEVDALLLPTVYALPVLAILFLIAVVRMARLGTGRASRRAVLPGVLFVVGGATFDIVATVIHSPDLELEGNPVARALLDTGHGLTFTYVYGAIAQLVFVAALVAMWVAFLRHRERLVDEVGRHERFWPFFKAATGARHLGWREWIVPLRMSEFPHPYPVVWILVAVVLSASAERWFLGLEWFGLVPLGLRWWVFGAVLVVGQLVYFAWLRRATRAVAEEAA